ncbi:MAG: PAS domain S-box protein, partial [Methanomicrobiales archaeon]|nr:PAS domain S-box protein [Methanomicrobiales archaeon]
ELVKLISAHAIIGEVNAALAAMYGVKPEDMIGRPVRDFAPDCGTQMADLLDSPQYRVIEREEQEISQSGEPVYIVESYIGIVEAGILLRVWGVQRNITDKKKMEIALKESEEKFRRIADNAQDIIYRMTLPEGRYEYISPAAEAITGYRPEEFYADLRIFGSIIHPDWRTYVKKNWENLVKGVVPPTYEYQIVDRTGRMHWLNQRNVLIKNDEERPIALEGIVTDITENRLAQEALRESEERYRTILENTEDGFLRVDASGTIVMASPSITRMLGYASADDLIGIRAVQIYRDPDTRNTMIAQMVKDGHVKDYEVEFVRKDGTAFWVMVNGHVVTDRQGRLVATEGIVHDITEQRTMEHALREANRKLSLLNSITRHDVANQLVALHGFTQIASMMKTDPVIADYLARIARVTDTIGREIEFTRTYQELGNLVPAWFRVRDIVDKATGNIPVRFSGTCRGIEVFADPMLERVFFNLFDNAARHGGRVTSITVRCEREPDGVIVIVEDDGIGVPATEKEKIFERGYGKHTGLGLFLAKEILAITKIRIRETGIPGEGARFEILVPKSSVRSGSG